MWYICDPFQGVWVSNKYLSVKGRNQTQVGQTINFESFHNPISPNLAVNIVLSFVPKLHCHTSLGHVTSVITIQMNKTQLTESMLKMMVSPMTIGQ